MPLTYISSVATLYEARNQNSVVKQSKISRSMQCDILADKVCSNNPITSRLMWYIKYIFH
jgi:hypothetical protein